MFVNIFRYFVALELLFAMGWMAALLLHAGYWTKHRSMFLFGCSFICYAAGAAGLLLARVGNPLSWYSPTLFLASTLLLFGLANLYKRK